MALPGSALCALAIAMASAPAPDGDLLIPGPLRRNAGVLLVIAAAILIGPTISRFLKTFRGVVLQTADGSVLLAQSLRPPLWLDGVDAREGEILAKDMASWSARVVPEEPRDRPLIDMYERFVSAYEGTIVEIRDKISPTASATAVVVLVGDAGADGGGKLFLPLDRPEMGTAAVGRRVRKTRYSWDPTLLREPLLPDTHARGN